MNKIYKIIWSKAKNCFVVASELAKNHTKSPRNAVVGSEFEDNIMLSLCNSAVCSPVFSTGFIQPVKVNQMGSLPNVENYDFKITVAAIVKNEAKNVPTWVKAARSCADEIVVVDTGSTDGTVERFAEYGIECYHYEWQDDFAAAKNYMISLCHSDWIVLLDGDEWFREDCNVRKAIAKHHGNPIVKAIISDWICLDTTRNNTIMFSGGAVRAFRNQPDVRYFRKVHENLTIQYENFVFEPELKLYHTGYSGDVNRSKHERNLRIMRTMFDFDNGKVEFPTDWRYVQDTYAGLGDFEKSLWASDKMLEFNVPDYSAASWITRFNVLFAMKTDVERMKKEFEYCFKTVPTVSGFRFLAAIYYIRHDMVPEGLNQYIEGMRMLTGPQDKVAMEHSYWRMYMPEASALVSAVYLRNQKYEAALYACKVCEAYCGKSNWTNMAFADIYRALPSFYGISTFDMRSNFINLFNTAKKGILAAALISTLVIGMVQPAPAYADNIDITTPDNTEPNIVTNAICSIAIGSCNTVVGEGNFVLGICNDLSGSGISLDSQVADVILIGTANKLVYPQTPYYTSTVGIGNWSWVGAGSVSIGSFVNNTDEVDIDGAEYGVVGDYSVAIGSHALTQGDNSIAVGSAALAKSKKSISLGTAAHALGLCSIAIGACSQVDADYSVVIGENAWVEGYCSVGVGAGVHISGECSVAVGDNSVAYEEAVAIGNHAAAYSGSVSIGRSSYTDDSDSVSLGINSVVEESSGTALGSGAYVTAENSVALGADSAVSCNNTVSVGHLASDVDRTGNAYGSDMTRRIVNVSDGIAVHDASTVGQTGSSLSLSGSTLSLKTATGATLNSVTLSSGSSGGSSDIHLYAGNGAACNAHASNGQMKLTVADGTTVKDSVLIKGVDHIEVFSDNNGNVTILKTPGGLIGGENGVASGDYSTVSGGWCNTASADSSSVSGGVCNEASADDSSISGGSRNTAAGCASSISGGECNYTIGYGSSVSGGKCNTASGCGSSVTGGFCNVANTLDSSVTGGTRNIAGSYGYYIIDDDVYVVDPNDSRVHGNKITINGVDYDFVVVQGSEFASVTGGSYNAASGESSSVTGGFSSIASGCNSSVNGGATNLASGCYSVVSSGLCNTASGEFSAVVGGSCNTASGTESLVSGGHYNTASGTCSAVFGGHCNTASCSYSVVVGGACNQSIGAHSTVIGGCAGVAYADYSIAIGGACTGVAGCSQTAQGSVAIGEGAIATRNSEVAIGSSSAPISLGGNLTVLGTNTITDGTITKSWSDVLNVSGLPGCNNIASGCYSYVSGGDCNIASGCYSSVSGGECNTASCFASTVTGGVSNSASNIFATVSGGECNIASAWASSVTGGLCNLASSNSASVTGGFSNTASCDSSSISGGSCNTVYGPSASISGGSCNYAGQLNLYYPNYPDFSTAVYIPPSCVSAIHDAKITVDGVEHIVFTTEAQSPSVSGGQCNIAGGDYSSVSGGVCNIAAYDGSSVSGGYCNIASGGYSSVSGGCCNVASGGYSSITGGENNSAAGYGSSVSGGSCNVASGCYASVLGGEENEAQGSKSSVTAGLANMAFGDYSSVTGGAANQASCSFASISAGGENLATGYGSSISGGYANTSSGCFASVTSGRCNVASGCYASVSGGHSNTAGTYYSYEDNEEWVEYISPTCSAISADKTTITVGSCTYNLKSYQGAYSSVSGGSNNLAIGDLSAVTAGCGNIASGCYSSIVGGECNTASGDYSFVTGGCTNIASGKYSSIVAGMYNIASGEGSSVSGGHTNLATDGFSSVSGGKDNLASCGYASVSGGWCNTASGIVSSVSGGFCNVASCFYSSVSGGQENKASAMLASVSGGRCNIASCGYSSVSGGTCNTASGCYSSVIGGQCNTAGQYYTYERYPGWILFVSPSCSDIHDGKITVDGHDYDLTLHNGDYATVSGGRSNLAIGKGSAVSGGNFNVACGTDSAAFGGFENYAFGGDSTVVGGMSNRADGDWSLIAGGTMNCANCELSSVFGGHDNVADAEYTAIFGGYCNTANCTYAVAVGGFGNQASGDKSLVLGGDQSIAYANDSVAIGGGITGNASCAETAKNSVAIGTGAVTTRDYEVAIGSSCAPVTIGGDLTVTSKIHGVTAGTTDTDAVNVGQMNQALADLGVSELDALAIKYDSNTKERATFGGSQGTVLGNLKAGAISATSMEAINGSQLYAVKQDIAGFASDIARNSENIRTMNASVTSALSSVAASGLLVDTMDTSKADASLNNLTDSGKRVLKQYAETAVQEYMAAQQESSTSMAPMATGNSNSNTLFVTNAGNGSLYVGEGSYVNGTSSIAIGVGNQVNANNSGAFGDPSIINADASYVLGNDDTINTGATGSFIVGNDGISDAKGGLLFGSNIKATADAEDGVTLGNNTQVSAKNAVALGSGSIADMENTISVGNATLKRRITNVAEGNVTEDSSDVITGSQLFITNEKVQKNTEAIEKKADADASNIDVKEWATKLGVGKVENGNTDLVTGGAVYDAVKDIKTTSDFVKESNGIISIAPNSTATKIDIRNSSGEGRVITGVVTDVNDVSSAANVGYVNSVATNVANEVNRGFNKMNDRIDKVGAGAAAMAGLVPGPMDGDEKWSISAAVGNYRSATAGAVGAFYKPTDNVMVAVKGSFGNDENMVSGGVGISLNKGNVPGVSKAQMVRTINAQAGQIQQQANEIQNMKVAHQAEISNLQAQISALAAKVNEMQK